MLSQYDAKLERLLSSSSAADKHERQYRAILRSCLMRCSESCTQEGCPVNPGLVRFGSCRRDTPKRP